MNETAIVAIARDEEPFVDEWLLYHRHLGISRFIVYDDNPLPGLQDFLAPHRDYTTVVRWYNSHEQFPSSRGDRQTKAYLHSLSLLREYQWVAFIDLDEFLVLQQHEKIEEFLSTFKESSSSIVLHWHTFGHNGHYEDPKGLVTAELTRRRFQPGPQSKCISRCSAIADIVSAHRCILSHGNLVDTLGRPFKRKDPTGLDDIAHINHYQCRSFIRWMNRAKRGRACDVPRLPQNAWKETEEGCLRQFVTTVAVDRNECIDAQMVKHKPYLEQKINHIRIKETP